MIDCSCEGQKQNCLKCAGTGFLQRVSTYGEPYIRAHNPNYSPSYRGQPSNVMKMLRLGGTKGFSSSSRLKCPACNEVFSGLLALRDHVFKKHAIPALFDSLLVAQVIKQTQSPVKPRKIPCLHCKKLCNGKLGLVSHVKVKHPESLALYDVKRSELISPTLSVVPVIKQTRSIVVLSQKVRCPQCKKLCNGELGLEQHVKVKHSESLETRHNNQKELAQPRTIEVTKLTRPKAAKVSNAAIVLSPLERKVKTYVTSPVNFDRGYSVKRQPKETSLDGSSGYYDKFYEGGKLGSHPSHDDYGDESFS